MVSRLVSAVLLFTMLPAPVLADEKDLSVWQNLHLLKPGQTVEIFRRQGEPIKGRFASAGDDSVTVRAGSQAVVVSKADVVRVVRRGSGRARWYGMGAGAAAGAVIGAAAGARLANESAGDIDLKAAAAGVLAGAGALIGLLVGSALDARHSTIYETR